MRRGALTLAMIALLLGCAGPAWRKAATSLGLPPAEAETMVHAAETRYRQPATNLTKDTDGRVAVWLSKDGHGGTIVWFSKEGGRWLEKAAAPWWE